MRLRDTSGADPSCCATAAVSTAGVALAVAGLGAAGLLTRPRPFPEYPQASGSPAETVALPDDLPGCVARWLQGIYGDRVPVIRSVVITGRARIRPFGVWLPARFRFIHDAGQGYRHYIEATWFGKPIMKVNERYLDGRSLVEIPFVGTEQGPKVEQAANLGMWAELAAAAPAVLATDPRVSWQPLDDLTCRLVVPLGRDATDSFIVRFDPDTGTLRSMEAPRYRSSSDPDPILWIAGSVPGPIVSGLGLPAMGTATWADQGRPWAVFTTEDIRTNVDVSKYIQARGA